LGRTIGIDRRNATPVEDTQASRNDRAAAAEAAPLGADARSGRIEFASGAQVERAEPARGVLSNQ
jgi:hypothetical protein